MNIAIDRLDGLSSSTAIKGPCEVATTSNITLEGLLVVDGVQLIEGDRVLARDQIAPSQNGIWIASTGNWRRAADFSRTDDVREGTRVGVVHGATYANTTWQVATDNPIYVDITHIVFTLIGSQAGDLIGVASVPALASLDVSYGLALVKQADNETIWIWREGDYSAEVAADSEKNTYVASEGIPASEGAWVRALPTVAPAVAARSFNFNEYRSRVSSDQTAFESILADAMILAKNSANQIVVDLNGCMVELTRPVDARALTGQASSGGPLVVTNGGFKAIASDDWATTTIFKTLTWTKNSNVVAVTEGTTGLRIGMAISSAGNITSGLCRYSYITEIVDGTTIKTNTYHWKTGTGGRTIYDFKFMLDFRNMDGGNKQFRGLNIQCAGLCSFCILPNFALNMTFDDIDATGIADILLLDWSDAAGGLVVNNFRARPQNNDPATRTAIGLLITRGDAKFHDNYIIGFQHSMVMHGSSYLISGCHNFQGSNNAVAVRSSAFLHTQSLCFCTYTGNYIDNGGIEWTSENQESYPPSNFRSMVITGNIFTFASNAQPGSYHIEIIPCVDGADLLKIANTSITSNTFRKLGDDLGRPFNLLTTHGNIEGALTFDLVNNNYTSFTNRPASRFVATLTKVEADINDVWNFGLFPGEFPFDLEIARVISVAPGGLQGLFDAADAAITPSFTTKLDGIGFKVLFSEACYGQVTVEVDCSLTA